jgi:O-acetyl-ADP-ribose deacetylase (regulator of RNase III)
MTLERRTGDLLTVDVDALVNPVNTHGVMGAGLALQFKRVFPENFVAYQRACRAGDVAIGRMHVVQRVATPRFIINFPTKEHWRNPSKLEYVRIGLCDLVAQVRARHIQSIAIPPLGCGLGGLDWAVVAPLIEQAFARLPHVRTVVFTAVRERQPEIELGR